MDGPLSMGGEDHNQLCIRRNPHSETITYGFDAMRNTGSTAVQLIDARLVKPHGIELSAAYVVPITGHNLIGASGVWPPPRWMRAYPGSHWDHRSKLADTRIPPHAEWNLVLRAAPTSSHDPGWARVRVRYRSQGKEYLAQTSTEFVVRRSCTSP
jgi:hypothetical protein